MTWNQRSRAREGHGYWLQPVKSSGVNTSEKTTLIRFGVTSVPSTSPSPAPSSAARTSTARNSGSALQRQGIEPSTRIPTGIMIAVASRARSAAKRIFSTATSPVRIGASSRIDSRRSFSAFSECPVSHATMARSRDVHAMSDTDAASR